MHRWAPSQRGEHAREIFSSSDAYKTLERFSKTLPDSLVDSSRRPTYQVQISLDAIEFLAGEVKNSSTSVAHRGVARIEGRWISTLGPCVEFFLKQYIAEEPHTIETMILFERIAEILPTFAMYPITAMDSDAATIKLKSSAPWLPRLLAICYVKAIEAQHSSWMSWTAALCNLKSFGAQAVVQNLVKDPGVDLDIKKLASLGVKHIRTMSRQLQTMGWRDLDIASLALNITIPDPQISQNRRNTFHFLFLLNGGVSALVDLLRNLTCRRKVRQRFQDGPDAIQSLLGFTNNIMQLLHDFIFAKAWVSEAMDEGILQTMFRAALFFSEVDEDNELLEEYMGHCTLWLKRIAAYLMYPSVLHRFSKGSRRIEELELTELLQGKQAEEFLGLWRSLQERGAKMEDLFRWVNDVSAMNCEAGECPLKAEKYDPEQPRRLRLVRCSGCELAVYCSRECAKKTWPDHRDNCRLVAPYLERKAPPPSFFDMNFIRTFIAAFIKMPIHMGDETDLIQIVQSSLDSKRCILLCNFGDPDFDPLSFHTWRFERPDAISNETGIQRADASSSLRAYCDKAGENDLIIASLFPMPGCSEELWPIIEVFNPLSSQEGSKQG
ncbi:hypothetical protein VNI00_012390 [Paramarasmius palmivorus]|uniref:MYND-type domain-containing protein n=1 Tax=Paramarasmius palmivorus TaxID=297713 RepID=A0AAW0C618_9AGAR